MISAILIVMRTRLSLLIAMALVAVGLGACGSTSRRLSASDGIYFVSRVVPASQSTTRRITDHLPSGGLRLPHRITLSVGLRKPAVKHLALSGKTIGVDPGHNGGNFSDPSYIGQQIWNGREYENCNTTGTETNGGYTEARFNWNVAHYLVADLRAEGARLVLTRHSNTGVGPCVNKRAQIFNDAHVNVGVAIHGDGAGASDHGFAVLTPVADGINNRIIGASNLFARDLRAAFITHTGMPVSNYDGVDGIEPRDDLAGENLARTPYVLIECGNMRNAGDAALETSPAWQKRAAAGIAAAITYFLR